MRLLERRRARCSSPGSSSLRERAELGIVERLAVLAICLLELAAIRRKASTSGSISLRSLFSLLSLLRVGRARSGSQSRCSSSVDAGGRRPRASRSGACGRPSGARAGARTPRAASKLANVAVGPPRCWAALGFSRQSVTRERAERDLELLVVGLDGRDLLHQKARPEQRAERAGGAVAREDALDLERDRGDERQERQLQQEEEHVVGDACPGRAAARSGPSAVNTRIETSATITRNVVPQRGCSVVFGARVLDGERFARLVGVDRLVLGAVILKNAVDLGHAADEQHVADRRS